MDIIKLLTEQLAKVNGIYRGRLGGFKYGHDYNILKAVVEHCSDKVLVENLVQSLDDTVLMGKVRLWMDAGGRHEQT